MKRALKLSGQVVSNSDTRLAMTVGSVTIFINIVLFVIKLVCGFIAKSDAMISDAVHTASDIFTTIIVMVGIRVANKESDVEHPYGHERMECLASIFLGLLLALVGLGIGMAGIEKIRSASTLEAPGFLALAAAFVSIVVKEWQYWYSRAAALKIESVSLMADAWHHRSDALSSLGAFVGILGARLGYPVLDPVASLVICAFILVAAWGILRGAANQLVDKSCDKEVAEAIAEVVRTQDGVERIDDLKTRLFGSKVYVDVEIVADRNLTLYHAHEIAEVVHNAVESKFARVKHCMVHINPSEEPASKADEDTGRTVSDRVGACRSVSERAGVPH